MKVLLLTHRVPYPPNRGDRIRAYHLLRFLSAHFRVSLACLAEEPFDATTKSCLQKLTARLAIVPHSRTMRWARATHRFARGGTATSGLFESAELRHTVQSWAREESYDCVIAYCSSMAPYVFVPELKTTPVLIDLVDVDSQKWLDYSQRARSLKRLLYRTEGQRLREEEKRLAERATGVVCVSEAEADLFRSICPSACTFAIMNGVELDYFQAQGSQPAMEPFSCVFVGALDYGANVDALRWFCAHVWPEVIRREPRATAHFVGRCPTASVRRLASMPGVSVAADVADVRPYLQQAAVSIAPLQIARGIQNKVLESMAMGKAVLASPGALTGLNVCAGEHVVEVQSPIEWTEGLIDLWRSDARRAQLGLQARQFVQRHHAWNVTLQPWLNLIKDAAVRGAAGSGATKMAVDAGSSPQS